MSEQATLKSIARSRHTGRIFLICRRLGAHHLPQADPSVLPICARLWYNPIGTAGAMSVTLTNAEKQARYRERHLGVDGEKVASSSLLNAAPGRKWDTLHTTEVIQ